MRPPYVTHAAIAPERPLDPATFPGKLPFTRDLSLEFDSAVTFFVGENGSGKSTLLEAMAVVARLPIFGGGMNELGLELGLQEQSLLAESLRLSFTRQPKDRYFFRAETQAYFAQLLDQRRHDADFNGDPYRRYGGKPLHEISHGEAFLGVMTSRFQSGLFFLDEPESALSPQRQLHLLALMHDRVSRGETQFFIATHSPILLTFPGATVLSFDEAPLAKIKAEETNHFQITRDILNHPERYWQHLARPVEPQDPEQKRRKAAKPT